MNIRSIEYFSTACLCGSISTAARRLGITAQGLSLALKRLSEEVGAPLVSVQNGMVTPTPYGDLFLEFAQSVQSSLDVFEASVATLKAHEAGIVRLGCVPGFLGYAGEDDIIETCRKVGVEVYLTESASEDDLERMLADGSYDLVVLSNPQGKDIVRRPLVNDVFFVWVYKTNPLYDRKRLSLADLDGQRLAVMGMEERWFDPVADAFRTSGIDVSFIVVGELLRILENALTGDALGLTTRNHAALTRRIDGLRCLPLSGIEYGYSLCYRSEHSPTDLEIALYEALHAHCQGLFGRPSVSEGRS